MSNLGQIVNRHVRDHWKDALFIAAAVVLTALSISSVTSKAAGNPAEKSWSAETVTNPNVEISR